MLPTIRIRNRKFQLKLREDRAILLICIGIALVFWLLVKLSQTYSTVRPVAFKFQIPENETLSNAPPEDMTVEIEGTGWDLLFDYFSGHGIVLEYDLESANRLQLSRGRLRSDILADLSSSDIQIEEVNPESLNLVLEEKISKKVPVTLNLSLSFASEYHLRDPVDFQPDSIVIAGPKSKVSDIQSWPTDSLIIQNLKSSQVRKLSMQSPPREMELKTKEVEVRIEVEQFTEKSLFVPLQVKNIPETDSIRFFPQRVRLRFVVGLSKYNEVTDDDFQLEADLKGVALDTEQNQVPIRLTERPDFVKNIQFTPKVANFFIVKEGASSEPNSGE